MGLIRRVARRIRTDRSVVRGIGDDCAVLLPPAGREKYQLFASDMLVEKVHFRSGDPPEGIGWKALAVNISDIAAMGGVPRHAVISLGLPRAARVRFVDRLYRGLTRCAGRFGVNLVGGDTDRSDRIVIDVAILGEVEKNRVGVRSGARAGDHLLVTGRLGGSLRSGRHLRFTPRLREARALGDRADLHAMIDLSDGLAIDLERVCAASRTSVLLEAAKIPRHSGCSLKQALTDGEDFELLIAVSAGDAERLLSWSRSDLPCGLHRIGRVIPSRGGRRVRILSPDGKEMRGPWKGFQHF